MMLLVMPRWTADAWSVTDATWAALLASVRRNPNFALAELYRMDLSKHDDTLPDDVVQDNDPWSGNKAFLTHYRTQARICRRVAAVAVLCTAWHRSHGLPVHDVGDKAQSTRTAELVHMVQLRRVCRVQEGKGEGEGEVVEPFGRCVEAFL